MAFVLSVVSGLYIFQPWMLDAGYVYFGFPFQWLEAGRSRWGWPPDPWHFTFLWPGFIIDFLIYGAIVTIAMLIYERKLEHISKPELQKISLDIRCTSGSCLLGSHLMG